MGATTCSRESPAFRLVNRACEVAFLASSLVRESELSVRSMFDLQGYPSGGAGDFPHGCVGLAFVAPFRLGIYAGGVAADPSSQPALPISKRNLGRLDTLVSKNV